MMAQFDVYRPSFTRDPDIVGIVSLQSDLLRQTKTTVIAPLRRPGSTPLIDRLTPVFELNGERLIFSPAEVASISTRLLGPPVANLASERDRIIAALDVLFTGI